MRYAVLHHTDIDEPHYDLLVETSQGSDLSTWRIAGWPVNHEIDATRLKDHRRFYLTYEGEIPGHRGRVERIACGDCDLETAADGSLTVTIQSGGPLDRLELRKMSGDLWHISTG